MTREEAVRDIRTVFTKDLADEIILTLKDSKSNELSEVVKNTTNGDVIKDLFPNLEVEIEGNNVTCWINEYRWNAFDYDWWNAPYKGEK